MFSNVGMEYFELFVSKHLNLPNITLEEHRIELMGRAKPTCAKQQKMALDKMQILKEKLDRLLEGGFITGWVSPIVIVPKNGGHWRVCVNYGALRSRRRIDNHSLSLMSS